MDNFSGGEVTMEHLQQQTPRADDELTVRDLFNAWVEEGVQRKDGNAELVRSFAADVLPQAGRLPLRDFDEAAARALLLRVLERGTRRTAEVVRNNLAQMLTWANKRQPWRRLLAEGDPVADIDVALLAKPAAVAAGPSRSPRALSAKEIRDLDQALRNDPRRHKRPGGVRNAEPPLEPRNQHALWLLLATLCRVSDLYAASWEHVDLARRCWHIPADAGTQRDAQEIHLSDFALTHFEALRALTGRGEWCFPALHVNGHVDPKALNKQVSDRQACFRLDRAGDPRAPLKNRRSDDTLVLCDARHGPWRPHDLRRTGALLMAKMGVPRTVLDYCQGAGPSRGNVTLTAQERVAMRAAWDLLGETLAAILAGDDDVVQRCAWDAALNARSEADGLVCGHCC